MKSKKEPYEKSKPSGVRTGDKVLGYGQEKPERADVAELVSSMMEAGAGKVSLWLAVLYVQTVKPVPVQKGLQPVNELRLKPALNVYDRIYVVDLMEFDGENLHVRSGEERLLIPSSNIAFMRLK